MELDRLIRLPELLEITGASKTAIYRWVREGTFPRPVKLGPNSAGWRASSVRAWIESLPPAGPPSAAGQDEQREGRSEEGGSPKEDGR